MIKHDLAFPIKWVWVYRDFVPMVFFLLQVVQHQKIQVDLQQSALCPWRTTFVLDFNLVVSILYEISSNLQRMVASLFWILINFWVLINFWASCHWFLKHLQMFWFYSLLPNFIRLGVHLVYLHSKVVLVFWVVQQLLDLSRILVKQSLIFSLQIFFIKLFLHQYLFQSLIGAYYFFFMAFNFIFLKNSSFSSIPCSSNLIKQRSIFSSLACLFQVFHQFLCLLILLFGASL